MRSRGLRSMMLFLPVLAAFLFLILRGETASAAARAGLEACYRSVIPSLFPFLILTNLLLRFEIPSRLLASAGLVFERLFHIRRTAIPILLAGLIGGYPLGAEAAAEGCRLGVCSEEEAGRLTVFANNCSPGFLFGLVADRLPGGSRGALTLLLLQWAVSLGMGLILGIGHRPSPNAGSKRPSAFPSGFGLLTASVKSSVRSILMICAYIVFFSVFSAFLPESALLRGLLELTGGILLLSGEHAAVIAAFLIGWGGLSVCFQVFSAWDGSGLFPARYLPLRVLHGLLTAVLAFLLQFSAVCPALFALALFTAAFFAKRGRKGAFPAL